MVETCEHSSLYRVIHFILLSLSFYSYSIPLIHILSHSAISYHSILSTLILIPFFSLLLLFHAIVHSVYTPFIIVFVMVVVCTIPSIHSFTFHTHPSLSLHSSFRQPSDLIHFLFTPFHHTHTHFISLLSYITLHYHFLYHLTISHSSLEPFLFILYSILSFYIILFTLIHTILFITLYSLYSTLSFLSIYYHHHTLYYHLISFMYYSIHSSTHYSYNTPSLKTHSHYPSITLIYYSLSIPFSILFYLPQSLHLFILFILSYHYDHSAISHTLYNSLYQSFYFDFSLSLFSLSTLISY